MTLQEFWRWKVRILPRGLCCVNDTFCPVIPPHYHPYHPNQGILPPQSIPLPLWGYPKSPIEGSQRMSITPAAQLFPPAFIHTTLIRVYSYPNQSIYPNAGIQSPQSGKPTDVNDTFYPIIPSCNSPKPINKKTNQLRSIARGWRLCDPDAIVTISSPSASFLSSHLPSDHPLLEDEKK